MNLRGSSVLVTGGSGNIGLHLIEALLEQGARVSVVQRHPMPNLSRMPAGFGPIDTAALDLREQTIESYLSARRFDFVFHLAGNTDYSGSVGAPRLDFEHNVLGTFNLLEALRLHAPGARLVFVSSAYVYGEGHARPIAEDGPTKPLGPYGMGKLAAEGYVALYARLYGLKAVILRVFSVFGPHIARGVVFDLIHKAGLNPDVVSILGDGSQVRDLNPVANVVAALLLVAQEAPLQGEIYNVAYGGSVTIRELAEMIAEEMGIQPRYAFTDQTPAGQTKSWLADISKLAALGYRPQADLKQGIADTVAWYRREFQPGSRFAIDANAGSTS